MPDDRRTYGWTLQPRLKNKLKAVAAAHGVDVNVMIEQWIEALPWPHEASEQDSHRAGRRKKTCASNG